MTSNRFFKMAAKESQIYLRVQWRHSFEKIEIYLPIKFRWDIWCHGPDITTSGF